MSFDVDKEEFYETFAELQDAEGSQRALEWAWSALDWTQQELRKESVKSQSIVAEERAAVVAWLDAREEELNAEGEAAQVEGHRTWAFDRASEAAHIADCIERGEHRREEKG